MTETMAVSTPPVARKVLVIGLDGATPEYLFPWAEEGALPNLARLVAGGAWGPTRSTDPPFTAMAWPAFYTGSGAGKTGIFTYYDDLRAAGRKPATRASLRNKPIWKLLEEAGKRCVVVAVPMSYPPDRLAGGVVISGMDAPNEESPFTHPPELREEILADGYRIFMGPSLRYSEDKEALYREAVEISEAKTRTFTRLLREREWDFAMIVLNEVDVVSHFVTGPRLKDFYRETDRMVGDIMAAVSDPDTLVLVVSDHGVMELKGRLFVNEVLRDLGLLALKPEKPVTRALRAAGLSRDRVRGALRALGVNRWLRRTLPARVWSMQGMLAPEQEKRLVDVDMARSKLYFDCGYWLRLTPGSELTDDEFARLREAIRGLGGDVHRGADLYSGPHVAHAPDYVLYAPDYLNQGAIGTGKWTAATNIRPGDHTPDGVGVLSGAPALVRPGSIRARLVDWAPTLLYLMGLPVPADMDGAVVSDAVRPEVLRERPPRLAAAAGGGVRDRIRSLKLQKRI